MSDKFDDVLIHHGVKGMKWGVRRSKDALRRASNRFSPTKKERAVRQKRKDDYSRRRTLKQGDLDALVKRLEQEKKLKNLLQEDLRPGRTFVKKTITTSGGKIATAVATGVGVAAVAAILSSDKWGAGRIGQAVASISDKIPKIKK